MTINLKGFEYIAKTFVPRAGLTVTCYVANDNAPSSPGALVTSTFTNVNGMWQFNGLPDGLYDVKVDIPAEAAVKWYKGNSKIAISLNAASMVGPGAGFDNTVFRTTDGTVASFAKVVGDDLSQSAMVVSGYANPIINGNFEVWQRGADFPAVGHGAYTADRWMFINTSGAVYRAIFYTEAPPASQTVPYQYGCITLGCTTADTNITAGEYTALIQHIEGYNFRHVVNRPFTLSFWVKSSRAGTYSIALNNVGTASVPDRSFVSEYTINVANTWEYKTITVPTPVTTGVWNYLTGIGLTVVFPLNCGVTKAASAPNRNAWVTGHYYASDTQINHSQTAGDGVTTGDRFQLSSVRITPGPLAGPFNPRGLAAELALCYRYYESFGGDTGIEPFGLGFATTTVNATFHLNMQPKRAIPSITISNPAHFMCNPSNSVCTSLVGGANSSHHASLTAVVAAGLTAVTPQWLLSNSSAAARIGISAEL